ncbi:MAG: glycosyl transferase [Bacteroidota bacterium]|nr:glycosyl transferase [Bacteroidota bacterium]
MNIGIVANTAFNIYNFRLGLIQALQQEGHHLIAIAPEDEYTSLLQEKGIEFVEVKNLARKGTNPINDLKLLNEFRNIYKDQKLDVALQYTIKPNIYGTLAARFTGTKTICTVTGLGYTFLNKSMASKVSRYLYRLSFSFANKVLFQNEDDRAVFVNNNLVDEDKTQIVPGSGIDIEYFHPGFCKSEKKDETIRFLMIGRLLRDKGVYEYVEAAKIILQKHKDVEFHLLGEIDNDNPSSIKQKELLSWVDSKIVFHHKHTTDPRPFICMSDCIVLPSYREGMPRVILEGMAMGKPCITTDVPGCRDAVIQEKTGFLCLPGNVDALVLVLDQFIALSNEYKKSLCINARKRVESIFSNENISSAYIQLIRNTV